MKYVIRKIEEKDFPVLPDLFYEAIFIPEGKKRPDKNIINCPELACYFLDFGRDGDYGILAESENIILGGCWIRLFQGEQKGYGYLANDIPEICMSVFPAYRNQGIGTKLLSQLLKDVQKQGTKKVSLSVDKINYAFRMYQKFGFRLQHEDSESATMYKVLSDYI